MKLVWIAEAPHHPALYAAAGTDGTLPGELTTHDPTRARHFATQAECQKWCDEHPVPRFEPQQHGFADPTGD